MGSHLRLVSLCLAAIASTLVVADNTNIWTRLSKPPLRQNFDDFEAILVKVLPKTKYTISQWASGWIPSDCKGYASDHSVNAADFIIYQVQYADCSDPWIMCWHKSSGVSIESVAVQFGRIPIQMREWVKHVVTIPDKMGWAYMDKGNTIFMKPSDKMQTTMVHETSHAVDLNGGYGFVMSGSDVWASNYAKDSYVPDVYSQSNTVEDVAQSTVVSVLDVNVQGPNGGFATIEPRWANVHHQYATILTQARKAGRGNSLLVPGQNVACAHRMPNSNPVAVSAVSRVFSGGPPDVSLSSHVQAIQVPDQYIGPTNCTIHW